VELESMVNSTGVTSALAQAIRLLTTMLKKIGVQIFILFLFIFIYHLKLFLLCIISGVTAVLPKISLNANIGELAMKTLS
jgi:hypothetical protein